jgi:hypothetical protein
MREAELRLIAARLQRIERSLSARTPPRCAIASRTPADSDTQLTAATPRGPRLPSRDRLAERACCPEHAATFPGDTDTAAGDVGSLTLDASFARPASLPVVELAAATAPIIEGHLTAELHDEFSSNG